MEQLNVPLWEMKTVIGTMEKLDVHGQIIVNTGSFDFYI